MRIEGPTTNPAALAAVAMGQRGQRGQRDQRSSGYRLDSLSVPKASDLIADDLRERILSGALAAGTRLPPERILIAQTGLSRSTVREALRILEVQGLLEIRPGRDGGARVIRPQPGQVTTSVTMLVRGRRLESRAVLQAREVVELACARLAARRASLDGWALVDAADRAVAAAEPGDAVTADVAWHLAVATAVGNELLLGLLTAMVPSILAVTDASGFEDLALRSRIVQDHGAISGAIRESDAEEAVRRSRDHLSTLSSVASVPLGSRQPH